MFGDAVVDEGGVSPTVMLQELIWLAFKLRVIRAGLFFLVGLEKDVVRAFPHAQERLLDKWAAAALIGEGKLQIKG